METQIKLGLLILLAFLLMLQALRIKAQRQIISKIENHYNVNLLMLDHEKKRLTDMRVWFTIELLATLIIMFS